MDARLRGIAMQGLQTIIDEIEGVAPKHSTHPSNLSETCKAACVDAHCAMEVLTILYQWLPSVSEALSGWRNKKSAIDGLQKHLSRLPEQARRDMAAAISFRVKLQSDILDRDNHHKIINPLLDPDRTFAGSDSGPGPRTEYEINSADYPDERDRRLLDHLFNTVCARVLASAENGI